MQIARDASNETTAKGRLTRLPDGQAPRFTYLYRSDKPAPDRPT